MPGYVRAAQHYFQHKKTQNTTRFTTPLETINPRKKQVLSEKAPAEELNEKNKKTPEQF